MTSRRTDAPEVARARAIVRRLHRLPGWAAEAAPHREADQAPAEGVRRAPPGPRLPAGVADVLDAMTVGRELPHLLDRLGQCVRTVQEEVGADVLPDPGTAEARTWATECRWLADPWCLEWIETETAEVELELTSRIHARTGRCAFCDGTLERRVIGPLASAICSRCDHVANMRLTIKPENVEKWQQERKLAGARRLLGLDQDSPGSVRRRGRRWQARRTIEGTPHTATFNTEADALAWLETLTPASLTATLTHGQNDPIRSNN